MANLCAAVDGEAGAADDDLIKAQAKVGPEETYSQLLAMLVFAGSCLESCLHVAVKVKKAIRARGKQPDPNAEADNTEVAQPKARGRPKKKKENTVHEQSHTASSTNDTGSNGSNKADDNKAGDSGNKADDSGSKDVKQQNQEGPATPSKKLAGKDEDLTEDPSKRKADSENNPTPNKGGSRKRRSKKEAGKETTGKEADKDANEAMKAAWLVQDCLSHKETTYVLISNSRHV